MDYKSKLSENNIELQKILDDIKTLPTYAEGVAVGENNVRDGEARTIGDLSTDYDNYAVVIPSGYYAEGIYDVEGVYDFGYDAGYKEGLSAGSDVLEALGALCDWSIMTDTSSITTVCLINYHPTYYMSCSMFGDNGDVPFYLTEEGEAVYPEEGYVVVAPNSALDLTFDVAMSAIGSIYVENMRWSKDGTI